jgi:hypothetical protein
MQNNGIEPILLRVSMSSFMFAPAFSLLTRGKVNERKSPTFLNRGLPPDAPICQA